VTEKPLTKTESQLYQKSSWNPSSTADADIFCAHRLLLTEKLLKKTESLLSEKSSSKPSSTADAEIFIVHRLLLPHKLLTRTMTPKSKNQPRSQVLRLTLTSSAHIDCCCLRNRWRNLSPSCIKNHPRNQVLRVTLNSSLYIDYCCLINRWRDLGHWDAKINQEAKFYGWHWHLLRTQTTGDWETVDENRVPAAQKSSSKPSSTADADIFCAHRILVIEKPLTKLSPNCTKNHPENLVLRLTLTSSAHFDYWWLRNCWRKQSSCCPKKHPRNPDLRLTLKSSLYIDYYCHKNRWQELWP